MSPNSLSSTFAFSKESSRSCKSTTASTTKKTKEITMPHAPRNIMELSRSPSILRKRRSSSSHRPDWKNSSGDFVYVDALKASSMMDANLKEPTSSKYKSPSAYKRRLVKCESRSRSYTPNRGRRIHRISTAQEEEDTYVSIEYLNKKIESMSELETKAYISNWDLYTRLHCKPTDAFRNEKSSTRQKFESACKRAKTMVVKMKPGMSKAISKRKKACKTKITSGMSGSTFDVIEKQLAEAGIKSGLYQQKRDLCQLHANVNKRPSNEVFNVTSNITLNDLQGVLTRRKAFVMDVDEAKVEKVNACCKLSNAANGKKTGLNKAESISICNITNAFVNKRNIDGEARSRKTTLQSVFSTEAGMKEFREFLRSEYSEENFEFWVECEQYRKITSPEMRKMESRRIFGEYLHANAPREINIDSEIRRRTEQNVRVADRYVFDEVQQSVYNLMEKDSFRRFLNSKRYTYF